MTTRDPFFLDGPAAISYSGGRTSAYMLWRILQAHGGTLPADVHVTFANTGKERAETLDFVRQCQTRWGVPVRWLEYVDAQEKFREVTYETAARNGEPFEALIRKKKYLPNPVARFCTVELKIRVMVAFMRAQGYEHWDVAVGFRADEPGRVAKGKGDWSFLENVFPLAEAGVTLEGIREFWRAQPFDLQLQDWEGNCDLCFLKGRNKRIRIAEDRPDLVPWWARMEATQQSAFRSKGPGYQEILTRAQRPSLFPVLASNGGAAFEDDDLGACTACTD